MSTTPGVSFFEYIVIMDVDNFFVAFSVSTTFIDKFFTSYNLVDNFFHNFFILWIIFKNRCNICIYLLLYCCFYSG